MTSPQLLAGTASSAERDRPLIVRLMDTLERLDPERLEQIWNAQSEEHASGSGHRRVEESLIRGGLADEYQIARAYSEHYLLPVFDPPAEQAPPVDVRVSSLLPENLCRDHLIVPLADDGITLDVAVFCPDALPLVQELQPVCGRHLRPLFAPLSVIERLLSVLYGEQPLPPPAILPSEIPVAPPRDSSALRESSPRQDDERIGSPPTVSPTLTGLPTAVEPAAPEQQQELLRYIRRLLKQAFQAQASDIHLEPSHESYRVRFRVAGTLVEVAPPPAALQPRLVSKLKSLANVDPAVPHRPQEGTIRVRSDQGRICLRVNTCPTVFGERVVMRVGEPSRLLRDLAHLGLDPLQRGDLIEALRSPHGMVLVSGPVRSGRSTTLYSCLNYLNDPETNICTVEDRVELQIPGINQLQTGSPAEMSLTEGLRSLLRQDPDVVMVSEIADRETARLCIQTALRGHCILSTMHADDAFAAVARLAMIVGQSNLLAEALRLSVSQRLLRRLCTDCRTPHELTPHEAQQYGLRQGDVIFRAVGCSQCRQTGYRGHAAIFEVIPFGSERVELLELVRTGAPADVLRRSAARGDIQLLSSGVAAKLAAGVTSLEEAVRANVNGSRVRLCGPDK